MEWWSVAGVDGLSVVWVAQVVWVLVLWVLVGVILVYIMVVLYGRCLQRWMFSWGEYSSAAKGDEATQVTNQQQQQIPHQVRIEICSIHISATKHQPHLANSRSCTRRHTYTHILSIRQTDARDAVCVCVCVCRILQQPSAPSTISITAQASKCVLALQ